LFGRVAGRADNGCRVVGSNKDFDVFHEISRK
jgi:hypothetical protein